MGAPADPAPDLASWGTEVWIGCVNPWDCDRMGHLNTRFYAAHLRRGIEMLATLLGLSGAFAPGAVATVRLLDQETRFLKEARVGAALVLRAGIVEMGEQDAGIAALLLHGDGSVAASATSRLRLVDPVGGVGRAWPEQVRERAGQFAVTMPEGVRGRGVAPFAPAGDPSLAAARALGLQRIGLGLFGPEGCDVFGRMRPEQLSALVSDGIGTLVDPIHAAIGAAAAPPVERIGGAVLEQRAVFHAWPGIGDAFELRSGLVGVEGKVLRLAHWLLDPASSRIWATLDGVAVTLDLERRRAVEISAGARAMLETRFIGRNH